LAPGHGGKKVLDYIFAANNSESRYWNGKKLSMEEHGGKGLGATLMKRGRLDHQQPGKVTGRGEGRETKMKKSRQECLPVDAR